MCLLSLSELAVMNFLKEVWHFYLLKKEKFWWIVLILWLVVLFGNTLLNLAVTLT